MQSQLSSLLNPSQHLFPPTEGDIPFFEDAFDTESLKKFFQEQDSTVNSPSTILGNSRSFSEPQSSVYNSRSIFGSPLSLYGQKLFENSSINASPELPKRIPFKSEDLFGKSIDNAQPWTFDEDLNKTGRVQKVASVDIKSEDSRMEIVKGIGRITINVAGRFPNKDQPLRMGEGFRMGDLESIGTGQYDQEEQKMEVERRDSEPLEKSFMRKLVFTIERSVTPRIIEKKEKVKAKAPILAKKNSDADELKVERKNSTKNVPKKDSIDDLRIERKLSKESVTSTSKKSSKQKSKQKEDSYTS